MLRPPDRGAAGGIGGAWGPPECAGWRPEAPDATRRPHEGTRKPPEANGRPPGRLVTAWRGPGKPHPGEKAFDITWGDVSQLSYAFPNGDDPFRGAPSGAGL
jgi:hypothetical protein